jgi:hypothetical protein
MYVWFAILAIPAKCQDSVSIAAIVKAEFAVGVVSALRGHKPDRIATKEYSQVFVYEFRSVRFQIVVYVSSYKVFNAIVIRFVFLPILYDSFWYFKVALEIRSYLHYYPPVSFVATDMVMLLATPAQLTEKRSKRAAPVPRQAKAPLRRR